MRFARGLTAMVNGYLLCALPITLIARITPPLGILTQAEDAQLNSADAYPGLSVFEGESLSTAAEGKLTVRIGAATLALSKRADARLQKVEKGTHVDLTAGWLYFTSPENAVIEVHAEDAILRPEEKHATQAEVLILGPKILQVHAVHGNLEFTYRDEFQLIPEGETYRIYLDSPTESQKPAGSGVPAAGIKRKTVIYIVAGAVAAGFTAWGIHSAVQSSGVESPAKP